MQNVIRSVGLARLNTCVLFLWALLTSPVAALVADDSRYAPDAAARMKFVVNMLASHEVHVARFYLRKGAYVAAANRAQTALTTYPQAPANEEGLLIMVKAYDAMGLADLRNDAERVMRANFPNSKYLASDPRADGRRWWHLW